MGEIEPTTFLPSKSNVLETIRYYLLRTGDSLELFVHPRYVYNVVGEAYHGTFLLLVWLPLGVAQQNTPQLSHAPDW